MAPLARGTGGGLGLGAGSDPSPDKILDQCAVAVARASGWPAALWRVAVGLARAAVASGLAGPGPGGWRPAFAARARPDACCIQRL